MAIPFRFTDLDPHISGAHEFVVRHRKPTLLQLVLIFLSALMIAVAVSLSLTDRLALLAVLITLVGLVGWYVLIQTQRNRDLVLATEFQNALFASALGMNNKFCLIVRQDGNIVYLDRPFQDTFPEFIGQHYRTLDALLSIGKVEAADAQKIRDAVRGGIFDKMIFNIHGAGNIYHKVVLTVEPILRRSGFILLRGRDFIETRVQAAPDAAGKIPHVINRSTITLFSYVMDTMNMGVYMTGPSGNIIYANPVLEDWLGYGDGEMTSSSLSLSNIIRSGIASEDVNKPVDFEGEVSMLKKAGGTAKYYVNQKIIKDEQGKPIGSTAIVHQYVATISPNSEIKSW